MTKYKMVIEAKEGTIVMPKSYQGPDGLDTLKKEISKIMDSFPEGFYMGVPENPAKIKILALE